MTNDILCGNDLHRYVKIKFQELWATTPQSVTQTAGNAGCNVEDHDRGLRSWVALGVTVLSVPAKGYSHDPIRERTRFSIDAQLREHIAGLQEMILGKGS